MASYPRRHRRRSSMEEPLSMSDIIYLKDELNKLHERVSPQCLKHLEKMSSHVDEFEKDYRRATRLQVGGVVVGATAMIGGLVLSVFTAGIAAIAVGLTATALTVAGAGVASVGTFQKKYKENNFRKTIETELEEFQKKISLITDMIEKICKCTEQILKDPTLSEHKANEIRERFSYMFEKMQLFQRDDNSEMGDRMSKMSNISGNLSKTFAEISSVLNVLEEILEGEVQDSNDRPAETPKPKQMDQKEFKNKTKKFINDMKEGINQLKNVVNEIKQVKERIQLTKTE